MYNIGDDNSSSKNTKKNDIPETKICEKSLTNIQPENTSDHNESDDSVTFVSASAPTLIPAVATQTAQKRHNTKSNRNSSGSDDVIEIEAKRSRSGSRTRSR